MNKIITFVIFLGGLGCGVLSLFLAENGIAPIIAWAVLAIGATILYGSLFLWVKSWNM